MTVERRANAIRNYFIEHDVDANRLTTHGKGTHKTNDVLRMNRRIESSTDSDKHFNVDIEKKDN